MGDTTLSAFGPGHILCTLSQAKLIKPCLIFNFKNCFNVSLMNTLIHTGTAGLEALIITDEDEVLACGKNEEGCLGLDNEAFQVAPVNIPELEKQKVKGELF